MPDQLVRHYAMPATNAYGTVWPDCMMEGFLHILTPHGVEDDEDVPDDKATAEQVVKNMRRATRY